MGWYEDGQEREYKRLIGLSPDCSWVFSHTVDDLTAVDVVGRNLFNHPIPGTVELSQYMLAIFILLGLAYAQQMKAHVAVSIFTSRLPHRAHLSSISLPPFSVYSFLVSLYGRDGWSASKKRPFQIC